MTSLVLGLLLNSAKNTLKSTDRNVHAFATELILMDRTLRQYGPETRTPGSGWLPMFARRWPVPGRPKAPPISMIVRPSNCSMPSGSV